MKKLLVGVGAMVAVGALVLGTSSAALALATPPDTDSFYSAGYLEGENYGTNTFWQVHPGTPTTLTVIEAAHDDPQMITDGAYDARTGASYVIGYGYGPECQLWSVDVATGAYTLVASITQDHEAGDDGPWLSRGCNAFDILDDGVAYITIFDDQLYRLDLTTGVATYVADIVLDDAFLLVLSTHPTTGISYGISQFGDVFTVDLSTGAVTLLLHVDLLETAHDADFDSAGTWWILDWAEESAVLLRSVTDMADIAGTMESADPVDGWLTDSVWIVPAAAEEAEEEPALAETGADSLPLLLGAAVLLLAGIGIASRRRRTA